MPAALRVHEGDPRDRLLAEIGDVSQVELFHNEVLCAVYVAPEKMASGLVLPDSIRDEDKHQGKVGLIIKTGPQAFKTDDKWCWPDDLRVGDWIFYRVSDGWPCTVNKVLCRMFKDTDIRGRIPHPDQVW